MKAKLSTTTLGSQSHIRHFAPAPVQNSTVPITQATRATQATPAPLSDPSIDVEAERKQADQEQYRSKATIKRLSKELEEKNKEQDKLTGNLTEIQQKYHITTDIVIGQKKEIERKDKDIDDYKKKIEDAESKHRAEITAHQKAQSQIIDLEEKLSVAETTKEKQKLAHDNELASLQQEHDIRLTNREEELRIKTREHELTKIELSELQTNYDRDLESKLIEKETIHRTEIIRIKSESQEIIDKRIEDLRISYQERVDTLIGRVDTHDKHYDEWKRLIESLEAQSKKEKDAYKAHVAQLQSTIKNLTEQQGRHNEQIVSYNQREKNQDDLVNLLVRQTELLDTQLKFSERSLSEAAKKIELQKDKEIKINADLHRTKLELYNFKSKETDNPSTPLYDERDLNDVQSGNGGAGNDASVVNAAADQRSTGSDAAADQRSTGSNAAANQHSTSNAAADGANAGNSIAVVSASYTISDESNINGSDTKTIPAHMDATTNSTPANMVGEADATSADTTTDIKPNVHLTNEGDQSTTTNDGQPASERPGLDERRARYAKTLVDAVRRAAGTLDVAAIQEKLRGHGNRFPVSTADVGDNNTYAEGTVGHAVLNGVIAPSDGNITPAFTRACKKKWIVTGEDGYGTISDIRDEHNISKLMHKHGINYIVTHQGRYINKQGHVVVDTCDTSVEQHTHLQTDKTDMETKWECNSTAAIYEPPTPNVAGSPAKSTSKSPRHQNIDYGESNVGAEGGVAGNAARESARISTDEADAASAVGGADAAMHNNRRASPRSDDHEQPESQLSTKRKRRSESRNEKRKQKAGDDTKTDISRPAESPSVNTPKSSANSTPKSISEPATTTESSTTASTSTASAATTINSESIWNDIKNLTTNNSNIIAKSIAAAAAAAAIYYENTVENYDADQQEVSLETAKDRVNKNDDAWLAKKIYNDDDDRRRSSRTTAGKKSQRN